MSVAVAAAAMAWRPPCPRFRPTPPSRSSMVRWTSPRSRPLWPTARTATCSSAAGYLERCPGHRPLGKHRQTLAPSVGTGADRRHLDVPGRPVRVRRERGVDQDLPASTWRTLAVTCRSPCRSRLPDVGCCGLFDLRRVRLRLRHGIGVALACSTLTDSTVRVTASTARSYNPMVRLVPGTATRFVSGSVGRLSQADRRCGQSTARAAPTLLHDHQRLACGLGNCNNLDDFAVSPDGGASF